MRSLLILLVLPLAAIAEVPVGEVMKFTFDKSKIFPGTTRTVWVYVPKQYDGKTPACLHVNQDGIQFGAVKFDKQGKPIEGVFDKLIAEKKMPVTIGVFATPGVVKAILPKALDRYNRSLEYDGLGPDYAKFLIDELLPHVETLSTADGRKIILSKDPNDRSIGGSSSGAIAAFTVAWERPDAFRRVFSSIGTYVGLRGGNEYPTLIRKVEPKPLRIFLEDGSNDLNIYGGDWWMANQSMERSLKFMGYEVEHNWGTGGHSGQHATEIFPEAMAWLWKDHPQPVKTGDCKNDFLKEILIPGEEWKLVGEGYKTVYGIAVDAKGEVCFSDSGASIIYKMVNGKPRKWQLDTKGATVHKYGSDGALYITARETKELIGINAAENSNIILNNINSNSLIALNNNCLYAATITDIQGDPSAMPYQIALINSKRETILLDKQNKCISEITVSPDQSLLYAADYFSPWIYSYQILSDGSLGNKQKFIRLHLHDDPQQLSALGMACDRDGRLWISTPYGLQICDQAGRVHCILPTPNGKCNNLTFGGPVFDVLYVTCGDKVYSRKVKVKGANAFEPPITPPKPKL